MDRICCGTSRFPCGFTITVSSNVSYGAECTGYTLPIGLSLNSTLGGLVWIVASWFKPLPTYASRPLPAGCFVSSAHKTFFRYSLSNLFQNSLRKMPLSLVLNFGAGPGACLLTILSITSWVNINLGFDLQPQSISPGVGRRPEGSVNPTGLFELYSYRLVPPDSSIKSRLSHLPKDGEYARKSIRFNCER